MSRPARLLIAAGAALAFLLVFQPVHVPEPRHGLGCWTEPTYQERVCGNVGIAKPGSTAFGAYLPREIKVSR